MVKRKEHLVGHKVGTPKSSTREKPNQRLSMAGDEYRFALRSFFNYSPKDSSAKSITANEVSVRRCETADGSSVPFINNVIGLIKCLNPSPRGRMKGT